MSHPGRHVAQAAVLAIGLSGCGASGDRLKQLEQRVASLEAAVTAPGAARPKSSATDVRAAIATEAGWGLSGGGREVYEVRLDTAAPRGGHPTIRLSPTGETLGKYGTWMRFVDAAPYRGKRVRLSAYTRTAGASTRADFWARVQAEDSPGDGRGLGGQWIKLPSDSDWTRNEIVLDVDPDGSQVQYGVGVDSPGSLWMDSAAIEIVGTDTPVTNGYPGERQVGDWLMTGVGASDFSATADGPGVRVEQRVATERYVAVLRVVRADAFLGKKAAASFEVETKGVGDHGMCVMKVQRTAQLAYAGFLGVDTKKVPSTTAGFTRCELATEVQPGAKWILYGYTYKGAGQVRVRGGRIDAK